TTLDCDTLFKNCTIGFTWLPISGYELTPESNIDFSKFPLWFSASLSVGGIDLYLNEFGYWSDKNIQANQQVTNQFYENPNSYIVQFIQDASWFTGDEFVIGFLREGIFEFYRYTFTSTMAYRDGIVAISSIIPNSLVSAPSVVNQYLQIN